MMDDAIFSKWNYAWLGAGLAVVALGYLCLAQPPVDGMLTMTVAPILLTIGYCVIIPIGILLGARKGGDYPKPGA